MANEHAGRLAEIGIGRETSRGSYVTPAYWIEKAVSTLGEKTEELEDENSMGRIETPMGSVIGKEWSEGDIEGNVRDDSIGLILYGLFGTSAPSNDDPVPDAHTHTITVSNINNAQSLSFTIKDPITQRAFTKGMINTFTLEAALEQYVTFSIGVVAHKARDITRTPVYTAQSVFRPQDVAVKLATSVTGLSSANATTFTNLTLTITKNAAPHFNLGTTLPSDIFNKSMIVEGSLTRLYNGTTERDLALTNSTTDAMSIKLTHADDYITGTTHPSLEFQIMGCDFREWNVERGNDDMVLQTIQFKGFYSVGESGMIQAILINGVSSY